MGLVFSVGFLRAATPLEQLQAIRAMVISNSVMWNIDQETLKKTHPIMEIKTNALQIVYYLKDVNRDNTPELAFTPEEKHEISRILGVDDFDQMRKSGRLRFGDDIPKAILTYVRKTSLLLSVVINDLKSDITTYIYYANGELNMYQEFHKSIKGDGLQMTFHPKLQAKSFLTKIAREKDSPVGWSYKFDPDGNVLEATFHEIPKDLKTPIRIIR